MKIYAAGDMKSGGQDDWRSRYFDMLRNLGTVVGSPEEAVRVL